MSAFQKMEPQAGGPALVGFIEAVKMDPLFFKLEIYPVLFGLSEKKAEACSSHKECRLCQWYYEGEGRSLTDSAGFRNLAIPQKRSIASESQRSRNPGKSGSWRLLRPCPAWTRPAWWSWSNLNSLESHKNRPPGPRKDFRKISPPGLTNPCFQGLLHLLQSMVPLFGNSRPPRETREDSEKTGSGKQLCLGDQSAAGLAPERGASGFPTRSLF